MRGHAVVAFAGSMLLMFAGIAGGQEDRDRMAGVWEMVSSKNLSTGATAQPGNIAIGMRAIYLEGHFVQFAAARDRAKLEQSPAEMTREQLLDRFQVAGLFGTYAVKGNLLSRRIIAAANPLAEGNELTGEYRLEENTLVIVRPNGTQQKVEERWRRLGPPK